MDIIIPSKIDDGTIVPDLSELTQDQKNAITNTIYLPNSNEYKVSFNRDYKIEQVRQEAKQRTEQVVESIADIVESHDFKKDNTGQDLAQKIRESKNKNL